MVITYVIEDREAIPIRAIPFITGGKINPGLVASIFAHTDQWELRRRGVTSYHLEGNGKYAAMLPKEWDRIELKFQLLFKENRAAQEVNKESQPIPERELISLLPPGCFVWKDEFEPAFTNAYAPHYYVISNEREGDRKLNFLPYIPMDLGDIITEGFPSPTQATASPWPWGDYETPLLRILSSAVMKYCLSGDFPPKKSGEIQEWIKAEMRKAGLPVSKILADHIETIISPRAYSHTRQRVKIKE